MTINIDPTLLRNSADSLNSVISTLNDIESKMDKARGDIQVGWQSEYTDLYLEKYGDVHNKLSHLITEITNAQKALRNTANTVEATEQKIMQLMNNKSMGSDSTAIGISVKRSAQYIAQNIIDKSNK